MPRRFRLGPHVHLLARRIWRAAGGSQRLRCCGRSAAGRHRLSVHGQRIAQKSRKQSLSRKQSFSYELSGFVRPCAKRLLWPSEAGLVSSGGERSRSRVMDCVVCNSAAVAERPERSAGLLNHTQYPLDVIVLAAL